MWFGWGNPQGATTDPAFMESTIANFQQNLAEPWQLIAGMPIDLEAAANRSVLPRTTYLDYNTIETEPSLPGTNLLLDGDGANPVKQMFETAGQHPALQGIMGNNMIPSIQLPRTFYFSSTAWNLTYANQTEGAVLLELGKQLYPDHAALIKSAYLALEEDDAATVNASLGGIAKLLNSPGGVRAGLMGRFLFPNKMAIAQNLQLQLEMRFTRQSLIEGIQRNTSVARATELVESYFSALLIWNVAVGWDRMLNITIWRNPIYDDGSDLKASVSNLKEALAEGAPYTRYLQIAEFFDGIGERLSSTYGEDAAMIGCVEPFKFAVIQAEGRDQGQGSQAALKSDDESLSGASSADGSAVNDDGHVKIFSFYSNATYYYPNQSRHYDEARAQKGIANYRLIQYCNTSGCSNASDIQQTFERDGMRSFLYVDFFMRACGNYPDYVINASICGLSPGWQLKIAVSLTALKAELASGALAGVFLGDEVWCVPCWVFPISLAPSNLSGEQGDWFPAPSVLHLAS
jgi:hypothetical protein